MQLGFITGASRVRNPDIKLISRTMKRAEIGIFELADVASARVTFQFVISTSSNVFEILNRQIFQSSRTRSPCDYPRIF